MIDNIFDKLIKKALENFRFRYNPGSWNRLEEKLEKLEEDDAVFDALVSEKLKSFSVPVASSSFARFEEKYLNDESPGRRLYYYIGAVAAVLILVALIFMNIGVDKKDLNDLSGSDSDIRKNEVKIDGKVHNNIEKNIAESKISSNEAGNSTKREIHIVSTIQNKNEDLQNIKTGGQSELTIVNHQKSTDFGLKYNPFLNIKSILPLYSLYNNRVHGINENIYFNELSEELKIRLLLKSVVSENIDVEGYVSNENKDNNINDINGQENGAGLDFAGIDSLSLSKKMGTELALNGYISPDMDIINTPNDLSFNVPGYTHIEKGVSTGLSLSYKKGKSEFETGFEYFYLSYSPHQNPVNLDNSIVYLSNISFNNISMPVNYKYHVVDNAKWSFYTVTGASANVTTSSKYEFIEKINHDGNEFKLTKLAQELQKDIHFKNTLYAEKDYSTGALEGGEFDNNFYIAVNAGVGVKRKFGKGYSLYFEPNYKYLFNRFNPNNDMIQKLNFKFGLSVNLNSI